MSAPHDHHFIPAFYLRQWCDPTKNDKLIEYSIPARMRHHHRAKAALEQMACPPEASVDGPGVARVRFGKGCPQPIRVRPRHVKGA